MAISQEMSHSILNWLTSRRVGGFPSNGDGDPNLATTWVGLGDNTMTGLTNGADSSTVVDREITVGAYSAYLRRTLASVWGAPSAGASTSSGGEITFPTHTGSSVFIGGVFVINSGPDPDTAGTVVRWTSSFNTVTLLTSQTPRIPTSGMVMTEL